MEEMYIFLKRFFPLLMLPLVFSGCGDEVALPSGLSIVVEAATDNSGVVNVQATAKNASSFKIYFGEGANDPVETTDGHATHTYTSSGIYQIVVIAYNSENKSITGYETVEIEVPLAIPTEGYSTPLVYDGMVLAWNDEFEGTTLNTQDWTYEIGTGSNGWGNNELEYYKQENTSLQDGYLIITARKEFEGASSYTSSRLITRGSQAFKYGRVDIRAVLPEGQGIWPALWMLGTNIGDVGWPACGEIDIMEMIGGSGREKTVHGTVHWDNSGSYASYGGDYSLEAGTFADKFHVFSIVWTETTITWYMDDIQYHVIDITPAGLSEFQEEFFFIFNVAVGGNWPGSPSASTFFPQSMIVDYIRVFQNI
jgi:hypothetical protein